MFIVSVLMCVLFCDCVVRRCSIGFIVLCELPFFVRVCCVFVMCFASVCGVCVDVCVVLCVMCLCLFLFASFCCVSCYWLSFLFACVVLFRLRCLCACCCCFDVCCFVRVLFDVCFCFTLFA